MRRPAPTGPHRPGARPSPGRGSRPLTSAATSPSVVPVTAARPCHLGPVLHQRHPGPARARSRDDRDGTHLHPAVLGVPQGWGAQRQARHPLHVPKPCLPLRRDRLNNGTKPVTVEHTLPQHPRPRVDRTQQGQRRGRSRQRRVRGGHLKATELLFNHCWGGYWQLAATAGLNKLTHSRYNGSRDIAMVLARIPNIQQIDFQGMEATAGDTCRNVDPVRDRVGWRAARSTTFGSARRSFPRTGLLRAPVGGDGDRPLGSGGDLPVRPAGGSAPWSAVVRWHGGPHGHLSEARNRAQQGNRGPVDRLGQVRRP